MKSTWPILFGAVALCANLLITHAADKKHLGGPKGGRYLEKTEPRAEFLVDQDHRVTITFYDAAAKAVPPTTQTLTVIADAPEGKTTIAFERQGDILVSKTKLPPGDGYNLVVLFKQTPDGKSQNHRFKLELHTCGGCHRAEYACICDE